MAETRSQPSYRRSLWLPLTVLGTGLALLLIAVMPAQDEGSEAVRTRLASWQAETRSRETLRTVLRGTPTPGNAWDDYSIVIRDVQAWKEDPTGALSAQFAEGGATPEVRQAVLKLIAERSALLDHVHRGTQRTNGQYPYRWERGARMELPSLLSGRRIANLAAARAKVLLDEGHTQDAVNLLLDLSVFGRDHSANAPLMSHLIGLAIYRVAFDGLRPIVLSGRMSVEELRSLAGALEAVDHDMPGLGLTLANEGLVAGSAALEVGEQPLFGPGWMNIMAQGGWRHGLSSRRLAVDFFKATETFAERSSRLDAMSFKDAMTEAAAITTEMSASSHPLVRMSVPDVSSVSIAHRDAVARLRLLRAAAILKATGTMPRLADPFGGDLLMSESGSTIELWSVGADGVDQKGSGSWASYASDGTGGDLVLELAR